MLNETWQLWRALSESQIKMPRQHPLIQPLPSSKQHVLRIRLDKNGSVTTVEDVTDDQRFGLWRIVKTSDGTFPVLKVTKPLLDIPKGHPIFASKKITNKMERLKKDLSGHIQVTRSADAVGHDWGKSAEKATLLSKLKDDVEGGDLALVSERFLAANKDGKTFIESIAQLSKRDLLQGTIMSGDAVWELLIGKGFDSSGAPKTISVLLVLDLDGELPNTQGVYGKAARERAAEILPTNLTDRPQTHNHPGELSAFGGNGELLREPYFAVNLPILNKRFPLASMASDSDKAKCNRRYGLTEYTVVPLANDQARKMLDAMSWLVSDGSSQLQRENREGKTWRGIASGSFETDPRTGKKKEKRDLLVVFLDKKPDLDAKTASYFGPGTDLTEHKFETDARVVCDALKSVVREHPQAKLNLFLIRKASDGQAQIALAEAPTAIQVIEAAERWQAAVRQNLPDISLYLQRAKTFDKRPIPAVKDARPQCPYPEQVVRLLCYQWVRDGSSPKGSNSKLQKANYALGGPGLGEVLSLMLRIEGKWSPVARRMLYLLITRIGPMLIGLFGAKHACGPTCSQGRLEKLFEYPRGTREIALRAIAVLAILLDALASRKEDYMKEAPYLVGQMLNVADTLHKDYCIVVRRGQVPNSLIGTSLMRRALDSPAGALADLSERILEYIRWAKTVRVPEAQMESGTNKEKIESKNKRLPILEAKKSLARYSSLACKLGNRILPKECNDVMKAQLLLGFLASVSTDGKTEEEMEEIQ